MKCPLAPQFRLSANCALGCAGDAPLGATPAADS
eukprot:CAMPEP_0180659446 /NCGR_PEP_ID=MMETSP1037_2-20121125/57588_1 /TAXON_ID=632150 /ORGANISM="Azadinium spinosum, Strain 3D9" /LENGTH=33 /DNA_ID= /DNA_START= /DNA_END= /DNA_ORIENTATION=